MSSDLVARLRTLAGYLRQHHSEPTVPGVAMSEAADRIEALEAALAKACDMLASIGYPTTARDIRSSILATPETESRDGN